ncbi:ArsR/SmtB family transcription factor [Nocardioides insulae]|uniref:ArsR/SmtB family transcription factor n=1 Tax=Nocardioides insulae TaxID=394734 RepID=UPI00042557F2|nr:metalloregulator ArsR/SmtB family transcription factor [Nocardioides insulae]
MSSPGEVFAALGDPVRRHLLTLLVQGELSAGSLVEQVRARQPISQPAVSQHLRVLRESGLVTVRTDGSRRIYALDPAGIRAAGAWLAALLDPLAGVEQPLDALATELARGRRAARRTAHRTAPAPDTWPRQARPTTGA